jgi:hypothetical protein
MVEVCRREASIGAFPMDRPRAGVRPTRRRDAEKKICRDLNCHETLLTIAAKFLIARAIVFQRAARVAF